MRIEREILSPRHTVCTAIPSPRLSLLSGCEEIEMMQRELEHLRRRCAEMAKEKRLIIIYTYVQYPMVANVNYFRSNVTRLEEQTRYESR